MTRIDAVVPASALTLDLARELERLAPFGLGNPDVTLLVAGCEAVGASTVGEGKHLRFRVRQHGRDAGSAIAFGLGGQLERLQARGALRRRLQAQAEPLERHRRAPARRAARLRHRRPPTRSCGRGSPGSGGPARRPGRPRRAGSSPSSRSTRRGGKRQLLESATFRALLAHGVRSRCPGRLSRAALGRSAVHAVARLDAGRWCSAGESRAARALARGREPRGGRAIDRSSSARSRSTRRRSRYLRNGPMARALRQRARDPVTRKGASRLRPWQSSMPNAIRTTSSGADRERRGLQPRRRQGADPPRLRRGRARPPGPGAALRASRSSTIRSGWR